MKRLFIILFVFCFQQMGQAQGWQRILSDELLISNVCNDFDKGYLVVVADKITTNVSVIKIDNKGFKIWQKSNFDVKTPFLAEIRIIQSPDSLFLLYLIDENRKFILKKLNRVGNVLWTKEIGMTSPVVKSNKNEYILIGYSTTFSKRVLLRLNLNGDTITHKFIAERVILDDFVVQNDGLLGNNISGGFGIPPYNATKINFEGQIIWQKNYELDTIGGLVTGGKSRVFQLQDSTFYISHNGFNITKNYKNGDNIWRKNVKNLPIVSAYNIDIVPTNDGGIIGISLNNIEYRLAPFKLDRNGNVIWNRIYNYNNAICMRAIIKTSDNGYLMIGQYDCSSREISKPFLVKIDENDLLYSNNVEGNIVKSLNQNCQINATDKPLKDFIIEAKNTNGDTFWGLTDSLGQYSINIDSGSYTLKAYPRNNRNLWQSCTPSVSKTFSSIKKTDTLDFLLSPLLIALLWRRISRPLF